MKAFIWIHDVTTGVYIFNATIDVLNKHNLSLHKLIPPATYGAPAMTGVIKGIITQVKEKCKGQSNNSLQHFQCIIHQQILCSNILNIQHVLKKCY